MSEQPAPKLRDQDRATLEVARRWPLVSGVIALALVLVGGTLIAVRQFDVVPYAIDDAWMNELYENRTPVLENIAYAFDWLGGGLVGAILIPVAMAIGLLLLKRKWGALYFVVASVASAGLVQLVKNLVDRPRPEQILVHADFGSFPSGHTANAATLAVIAGIIFRRAWIWWVGTLWVIAMLLSRNYLGAHWLTDTLGGLVLGAAVALIIWAPFAHRLHRETLDKRGIEPAPGVPAR